MPKPAAAHTAECWRPAASAATNPTPGSSRAALGAQSERTLTDRIVLSRMLPFRCACNSTLGRAWQKASCSGVYSACSASHGISIVDLAIAACRVVGLVILALVTPAEPAAYVAGVPRSLHAAMAVGILRLPTALLVGAGR